MNKPQTTNYAIEDVQNKYFLPVVFKDEATFLKFYSFADEYLDLNSDITADSLGYNKKPKIYPNTVYFTLSKLCNAVEVIKYLKVKMEE